MDELVVVCRHGRYPRVRQILDAQTGGSGHSSVISLAENYTSLYYPLICTVKPARNTQQEKQKLLEIIDLNASLVANFIEPGSQILASLRDVGVGNTRLCFRVILLQE